MPALDGYKHDMVEGLLELYVLGFKYNRIILLKVIFVLGIASNDVRC